MSYTIKDFKKVKNRETKKIKKFLNEEMRLGESNSDAEEVDLSKDLYPLSHYVNKREEMVEEMFTIISGNSLNKILPPLLKDMNLDELKAECLIHLLGMSKKRIISILEGREIDSSSESETHSEASPPHSNKTSVQNATSSKFVMKLDGCSDISNDSNEFDKREESQELEIELHHKEAEITLNRGDPGDNKMSKNKKRKSQTQDLGNKKKQTKVQNSGTEDETSAESVDDDSDGEKAAGVEGTQGKTLLDILELELRAKAIRALLKQGSEEPNNPKDSQDDNEEGKNSSSLNSKESVSNKKGKFKIERNYRKHTSTPDDSGKDEELGLVTIDLTIDGESSKTKDQNKTLEKEKFKAQDSKCENISIDDNSIQVSNDIDNKDTEESKLLDVNSPTKSDSLNNKMEEITESIHKAAPKSSWAERWLQSKDVNKVVSTSKMCANIRKRMRNARLAKQNSNSNQSSSKVEQDLKKVEGSVTEYQLLTKSQNSSEDKSLNETSTFMQDSENDNIQGTIAKTEITNSKECATNDLSQGAPIDCTVSSKTAEDQSPTSVSCDEK